MKTLNKILTALIITAFSSTAALAINLDEKRATAKMNIGLFAHISGLNDFFLLPVGADGDSNSIYKGSDEWKLVSNGAVRVSMTGGNLSDGNQSIPTSYELDDSGLMTFDTVSDSVHNQSHKVSAEATLGDIADQKSGSYAAEIVITVSAL